MNNIFTYLLREDVKVDHGKVTTTYSDFYQQESPQSSFLYKKDNSIKDLKAIKAGKAAQKPSARQSRDKSNNLRDIYQ